MLELNGRGAGVTQSVWIKRGSLEVASGHLSYVGFDDEQAARIYIPLHTLDRFRYYDRSRV